MSDLVDRVHAALAQIPHDADCGDLRCDCGDAEAYRDFQQAHPADWMAHLDEWARYHDHAADCRTLRYRSACCSREERVAQAVARAIEAAAVHGAICSKLASLGTPDGERLKLWSDASVAALTSPEPPRG